MGLALGVGIGIPFGGIALSKAALLLAAESNGLAVDGTDLSMVIKDQTTPANAFLGDPNSKFTYASPGTKWILNQSGVYVSGTTLRTEYNASGVALGVLIEDARTNLFLNSRSPVTQSITTTAQSYTISGLGAAGATLVLSGTATGTLTGTAAKDRDKLTFTATAGTLTVTVTGTWDFVNVEAGAFATSPIVTGGSPIARAVDDVSIGVGSFPIGTEITVGIAYRPVNVTSGTLASVGTLLSGGVHGFYQSGGSLVQFSHNGAATQALFSLPGAASFAQNELIVAAGRFKASDFAADSNKGAVITQASGAYANPTTVLRIGGNQFGGVFPSAYIKNVVVLPTGKDNTGVASLITSMGG
ncbi:MAG: hypothetical protein ACKO0Z_09745 [Betaproteobacteria bacterium]